MAEQIVNVVGELNDGIKKVGTAQSREEYEKYYHLVFDRLDQIEKHLGENRFLLGDKLAEADVRLFVTLTRFDVAYYFGYRLNKRRIRDYHNLWNYAKELYSMTLQTLKLLKRGSCLGQRSIQTASCRKDPMLVYGWRKMTGQQNLVFLGCKQRLTG